MYYTVCNRECPYCQGCSNIDIVTSISFLWNGRPFVVLYLFDICIWDSNMYHLSEWLALDLFTAKKLGSDLTCLILVFFLTKYWNFLDENWVLLSLTVFLVFMKTAVFSFHVCTELNFLASVFHMIICCTLLLQHMTWIKLNLISLFLYIVVDRFTVFSSTLEDLGTLKLMLRR